MPLFNLADIRFGSNRRATGPTKLIDPAYKGNYNVVRYPEDVGTSSDKGHYMIIHINEQKKTQFSQGTTEADKPAIIRNEGLTGLERLTLEGALQFGGRLALANAVTPASGLANAGNNLLDVVRGSSSSTTFQFRRPIKRTLQTIALYMPDTLNFDFNQVYNTPSTMSLIPGLAAAAKSLIDSMAQPGATMGSVATNMAPFIGAGASAIAAQRGVNSDFLSAAQQGLFGVTTNPLLEVIYSTPDLRRFQFAFMFYPRSEGEAAQVQEILRLLRFHQAPEVLTNSNGFFLVPPSEFDIEFYYNGKINPNIPPISTCVLESVQINYAPNGWASYESGSSVDSLVPRIGKTGMPVAISLTLGFRETEIVTKNFVAVERSMQGAPSSFNTPMTTPFSGGGTSDGTSTQESDGTELGR